MNRNGFTLIELLITVAIIGILAAVAIPGYIGQMRRAERAEAYTNLDNLRLIEEQVFADRGNYYPIGNPPPPIPAPDIGAAGSAQATRAANWTAIRAALPRWQPGPAANLKFSYRIVYDVTLPANPAVPLVLATLVPLPATVPPSSGRCFTAIATGVAGTRVLGDIFAVDCNNNKNY